MSFRLKTGGRLIDRATPLKFRFNGKSMRGFRGDTLSAALLGEDQMMVGRSFKYHRPRGIVASGAEEPNALVNLGRDALHEPNQRATTTELFDGLEAESQNHWPSLTSDIGAVNGMLARFLPAGFYYKTFIHPRRAWKHVFEPFIRQSAGLGKAPTYPDADTYEHFYMFVDVLVVGGGLAGLQAALIAGRAGARVLLIEQTAHWGGRAPVDRAHLDGEIAERWIETTLATLQAMPNVTLRTRCMGAGVYDHGYVLCYERCRDHDPTLPGPRHRLWKVRARQTIVATGAIERPLAFPNNDVPGVMLASAVRDYIVDYAIAPGRRLVVITNNDDAYRTALTALDAGIHVPLIVDTRPKGGALAEEAQARGIRCAFEAGLWSVTGRARVNGVTFGAVTGNGAENTMPCDAVAMSGGWSPVVHLWSHCGGKLLWSDQHAHFYPDPALPPCGADGRANVRAVGTANGKLSTNEVLEDATEGTFVVLERCLKKASEVIVPKSYLEDSIPLRPSWIVPESADAEARNKMWLDFQNDVKVADVQLAAREGFESVEHTKRYTTLGMATDQGKLSNINGLAVLSQALDEDIPRVGTTTFRPPYSPISMGAIAGEARGEVFQPLRKTPLDAWHDEHGADWEPVGQWRRPYCYLRTGETVDAAVAREVRSVRQALGLLDASTLGKIIVKGGDAGRFLDMVYTNKMSSLKVGRCRYGLMCSENGFLSDDGVVVRLDAQTFLCHTTTGGADRIHAHMEDWLQCEWWDWEVLTANVTEQWGQIAVVGPHARTALERLGGLDVSKAALPFMGWAEGRLADIPVRVFRISFSGELSYEIAVSAGRTVELWQRLLDVGQDLNVMPYGTEALHVLRAEKGFIMIGDETDGTVIPQDLGLDWAISKKKEDYLGKRAQKRSHMVDDTRWRLVGLETVDGAVLPDGVYAVENSAEPTRMIGRVTSTYHSPSLNRGIAMGLVERGPERMGEVLTFPSTDGRLYRARIVDPVVYDPAGEKQDVRPRQRFQTGRHRGHLASR